MAVLSQLDQYHLARAAIRRLPDLVQKGAELTATLESRLAVHKTYVCEYGEDMPEIKDWKRERKQPS